MPQLYYIGYHDPHEKTSPMKKADPRKIIQALNYFACYQPNRTLNKMKAYKLLWLADRYHLRQYGRPITDDNYYAIKLGPIPSDAKNLLDKKQTNLPIDQSDVETYIKVIDNYDFASIKEPNLKVFSESDIEVMKLILTTYNDKDQFELSDYSHLFPEWLKHKEKILDNSQGNRYKIVKTDFFKNIDDEYKLFNDSDELLKLTSEIYRMGCL